MHRRTWLILAIAIPLAVLSVFVGAVLTRPEHRSTFVEITPQEAHILRLKNAVAATPTDFDARLRLGWAYQQAGQYDRALAQYDTILKRRPRSMATLYYRGLIYRDTGADPQAMEAFRAVLAIKPDHVLAAIALGEYHLQASDYTRVLQVVRPVADAHPRVAMLQYLTGRGLEGTGDFEGARRRYRAALRNAPDLASARARLKRLDTPKE